MNKYDINMNLFISPSIPFESYQNRQVKIDIKLLELYDLFQDDEVQWDNKTDTGMGSADIKYGDTTVFIQHVDSGLWLSYLVRNQLIYI